MRAAVPLLAAAIFAGAFASPAEAGLTGAFGGVRATLVSAVRSTACDATTAAPLTVAALGAALGFEAAADRDGR